MSARRRRPEMPADAGEAHDLHLRLLRGRPRTTDEIRAVAPPGIDVAAALEALEADGLIGVGRDGLELHDPRAAVAALVREGLARREPAWRAAAEASVELSALAGAWREHARPDTAVAGSESVGDAAQWWRRALLLPGDLGIAAHDVRALPDASARERPWRLIVPCAAVAGVRAMRGRAAVEVRVARDVPGWLAAADEVALALRWSEDAPTGVTTTSDRSIVAALTWVFDDWWARATPIAQLDVFALLGAGRDDAEIASALDISVRTVQRRIGAAMDAIGARSRFELGVAWARSPDVVADAVRTVTNSPD